MTSSKIKVLILLPFLALSFITNAQNSYAEAIQMGDRALRNGQYQKAINMYDSAEAFDGNKRDVVRKKRGKVFDKIETLRKAAEEDKKQAENALIETEKAKKEALIEKEKALESEKKAQKAKAETQIALLKANRLVAAFYFYKDRFALAYGGEEHDNAFYFIDKNGNKVEKLGKWRKAEQFDWKGYAKVKKEYDGKDYLLDTLGGIYPIAYEAKGLNKNITALDLSNKYLKKIPLRVFKHPQIKILLLNEKQLSKLPEQIDQLKNLILLDLRFNKLTVLPEQIGALESLAVLDLRFNKLSSLPEQIEGLKNLTYLNLEENPISQEEQEKIKQLLPKCKVLFSKPNYTFQAKKHFENKAYTKAYKTQLKALEEDSNNYNNWFKLSLYALFVNKPKEAITAAQKTLTINQKANGVEATLALGYLLNNQWLEAEKIYLKWKGKKFTDNYRLWDWVFLQNIEDLEIAGIKHIDFLQVKALFGKLKQK